MNVNYSRIAMWSGPRNISTALMRSFENRNDAVVSDEPLYAAYLARTGYEHPGRDEILASQSQDIHEVFTMLQGPIPGDRKIWYQKHMAQHLPDDLTGIPWDRFQHAILIRNPTEMLTSFLKVVPNPTAAQTGLPQQLGLWKLLRNQTNPPTPILDAKDILRYPEAMLRRLCSVMGIDFQGRMLSWPQGERATDGVWARHWYANVIASTGFSSYRPKHERVPDSLAGVLATCNDIYTELAKNRLRPSSTKLR